MKRLNLIIVAVLVSISASLIPAHAQSDSQPTGFEFYFNGPARGMRFWTRSGEVWTETYSSGQKGTFRVKEVFHHQGATGTLVQKVDEGDFFVFIPDIGSAKMEVSTYKGKGPWRFLAQMQKVTPERYSY